MILLKTLRLCEIGLYFVSENICLLPKANGNIDVKEFMKVWTDQKGFPIVKIQRRGNVFHVEQEDVLDELNEDENRSESR